MKHFSLPLLNSLLGIKKIATGKTISVFLRKKKVTPVFAKSEFSLMKKFAERCLEKLSQHQGRTGGNVNPSLPGVRSVRLWAGSNP